jgi:ABC-type Fe3+/spermidine/putrescine transport system ATPase subunit
MTDETTTQQEGAASAAPSAPAQSGGRLQLINLTKVFPGGTIAVEDVNLDIHPGEYVVLLGPSAAEDDHAPHDRRTRVPHERPGAARRPRHRAAAGQAPDHHRLPALRAVPHRSVPRTSVRAQDARMDKDKRRARATEALEMVGLQQLADRRPRALSGGQQQRVALARALVTSPKALLLDEPLGDLDRLLQLRMRVELRNLQRQLGLTFVHVTHNQEEALTMADRIVVMHEGRIEQADDPLTISTRPKNEIVAAFMGDNNILRGTVVSRENGRLVVDAGYARASVNAPGSDLQVGAAAALAVRAASVQVHEPGAALAADVNGVEPEIIFVEYLGDLVKLHLTAGGERMIAKITGDRFPEFRGREGSTVPVSWKEEDVQLLGT